MTFICVALSIFLVLGIASILSGPDTVVVNNVTVVEEVDDEGRSEAA